MYNSRDENILHTWAFYPEEKSFTQHSLYYWSKVTNHSFMYYTNYSLNIPYASGTVVGTKERAVNKYTPCGVYFPVGKYQKCNLHLF